MPFRVDLPDGAWADLKGVSDLTGADQDAIFDAYDEIMAAKPEPERKPDPLNPSQLAPSEGKKLTNAESRGLRDKILGMVITAWSYDLALPYTSALKAQLPLATCNALRTAVDPMENALFGVEKKEDGDPKSPAPSPGSSGSSGSSPDSTESPLPEPPEEQ